jgi:putative ABC transport system ATP-binding protein
MSTILKAVDIKKEFTNKQVVVPVLGGISFEVEKGQFLAVLGPSGSGKTTLLNILSTIDSPTTGQVWVNGFALSDLKKREVARFRRDHIGFVFQEFNLLDTMTIQDNIALPLALNHVPVDAIMKKTVELTDILGITEQLGKYPYQLSGGQKQRAATARALIANPQILFADEPTGALDTKSSAELLHCFTQLNTRYHTTIVMVTHDANAASYSDKVLFMKDGTIYSDLSKSNDRHVFYQNILNTLSVMGGI